MLKPSQKHHLLKIIPSSENSIVIKGDSIAINNPWHFHPEIVLLYWIKGRGTNFIGNSIRQIEEGEILLLGKNLPHIGNVIVNIICRAKIKFPRVLSSSLKKTF